MNCQSLLQEGYKIFTLHLCGLKFPFLLDDSMRAMAVLSTWLCPAVWRLAGLFLLPQADL